MAEVKDQTTTVDIPGQLHAVYRDGKIERIVFMPHGSCAGYFGPAATVIEGDMDLDVENTDGPFWRAMQGSQLGIEWEE